MPTIIINLDIDFGAGTVNKVPKAKTIVSGRVKEYQDSDLSDAPSQGTWNKSFAGDVVINLTAQNSTTEDYANIYGNSGLTGVGLIWANEDTGTIQKVTSDASGIGLSILDKTTQAVQSSFVLNYNNVIFQSPDSPLGLAGSLLIDSNGYIYTGSAPADTPLTGLSIAGGAITSSSTVLEAFGALQNQINGISGGGTTTNALTIGTGLSGTSFNGSAPVTIAIDSTVATLTGSQALTNKTYNGLTVTSSTGTLTVANGTTITMPTATSTVLANSLGLSGGTTLIGGTAAGDKLIIQATSNSTHTAAKDLIKLKKNSSSDAATSVLLTIGDGQGLNNDEVSIYTGVNNGTSGYLLRAGATFAYFNASSSLRLQIGVADIIQLSSSTATFVQGLTISDAKNIVLNTTTGSKLGTATNQKLGIWNATPIIQPTTAIAAATFVTNTSLIANDTATFDGYTIGQVVKALRNIGILA